MKVLFVHPRKGLFQLTKCSTCGYTFECENCDAKLVAYRHSNSNLELVCHQCQAYYSYPEACPSCANEDLFSVFGGVDDLVENLEKELSIKVKRLDKKKLSEVNVKEDSLLNSKKSLYKAYQGQIYVTTRVFDPSIDYSEFDKIILVQAENLTAHMDYLVQEEAFKAVAELFNAVDPTKTEIVFDTNSIELDFFDSLKQLNLKENESSAVFSWYTSFLKDEDSIRNMFGFPPHTNLLLITTHQKNKQKAWEVINHAKNNLKDYLKDLKEVRIASPYPAKFLKRKGLYSYHLLIKFPKQYKDFAYLRDSVLKTSDNYALQVRLNPRHLF